MSKYTWYLLSKFNYFYDVSAMLVDIINKYFLLHLLLLNLLLLTVCDNSSGLVQQMGEGGRI